MQDHYAQLSPSLMLGMKLNLFHILFCFWLAILHVKGMISNVQNDFDQQLHTVRYLLLIYDYYLALCLHACHQDKICLIFKSLNAALDFFFHH